VCGESGLYNTRSIANVSTGSSTNWGVYGSYYGYHWGPIYDSMTAYSTRQGTLGIELINAKTKDLAWRMFASAKLYHTDPDKIGRPQTTISRTP